MLAPSHLAFGFFWSGLLASAASNRNIEFGMNDLTIKCVLVTFLGCLFPDLDIKSPISRWLPFLGNPIRKYFSHRTFMHSFSGLFIATSFICGLMYFLAFIGFLTGSTTVPIITKFFAWAYLSHLLIGTLNIRGIPYFFPLFKNPFGFPSFEEDRIRSGDKRWEFITVTASLIGFICLIPVIRQGANTTLANVFGQFYQLRDIYVKTVEKEVQLSFEGILEHDKSFVLGKALILAATDSYFLILWKQQVRYLGDESGDILLLKGHIKQLDFPPKVRTKIYRNRKIKGILTDIKGQVLISGQLEANQPFQVRRPFDELTIMVSAKFLRLEFSNKIEIEALQVKKKEEMSIPEMQQELLKRKMGLDSLICFRQKIKDMYQRDTLFTRIEEQRKELKKLEVKMGKQEKEKEELRFSGQLSLRELPSPKLLKKDDFLR